MKKENLLLIAEGHKLIALAYAREAGADLEIPTGETVVAETPVVEEQDTPKKPGKIVPKAPKAEEEPVVEQDEQDVEADGDEEEGYSLDELNAMTIKQLKELASENGIHIPKDTKKADMIDLIMEGVTESDESEEEVEEEEEVVEETTDAPEANSDEEEYEELTIADVEAMEDAELKDLAKEYEVDLPKKFDREKAIEAIVKALFEEEEIEAHYAQDADADEDAPEEDAEDDTDDEYLTEADLAEMSLTELKELAKEYEIEHPKVIKADKLRAILVEALFAEEEEDEESDETDLDNGDLAEEYGLNEMSVEELQELLTDHKIKAKGNKQALIAKVLEAIEEGVIEVDEEEGE